MKNRYRCGNSIVSLIKRVLCRIILLLILLIPAQVFAYDISNSYFSIQTGSYGEISSLRITGDSFSTNYVMNGSNSSQQNTPDHQWFGELLFEYRVGSGPWTKASTNRSGDGRSQYKNGSAVTVRYENSANSDGIRNFRLTERYSLVNNYIYWEFTIRNTSSQAIEFGDIGVPLAFNEKWEGNIYEERVLKHSFVGREGSFVYALRPSGVGPFVVLMPELGTGSGFEYQELWHNNQYPGSTWAFYNNGGNYNGLNVFYIHSSRISTRVDNGYIGSTSMILQPNEEKTYAYKIHRVNDLEDLRNTLYNEGSIDVNVAPGMIVPRNLTTKVDLHTFQNINSIQAQYGSETTITYSDTVGNNHKVYDMTFDHLGQNNITVNFGSGYETVLQFYVIEDMDTVLQQHASHIVNRTQVNNSSRPYNRVFDDWMMDNQSQRGSFGRFWGWGDDWGFSPGLFLAEKNSLLPVASEVQALDNYIETFLWNNHMREHHFDYGVNDFWQNPNDAPPGYNSSIGGNHVWLYRGYAYPHVYNTFFSMYKIAKRYPNLINYSQSPGTYLLRAYGVLNALHSLDVYTTNDSGAITGYGPVYYRDAGLMGESVNPDIIAALREENYNAEADTIEGYMDNKFQIFANQTYPYGSEYNFDNTGEEAVYTLAKMNNNLTVMEKVVDKTIACRSIAPVWHQYATPVSINGEMSWNFQYTASLAGYAMDDWMRSHSTTPELDARMTYAAKYANLGLINSGQISSAPNNIGGIAWIYQVAKGLPNLYGNAALLHGFRSRSGEGDLGIFGALRIISVDIAVDPIFGLYAYGGEVSDTGTNYVITPKDGIGKRLNLLTEKLYISLEKDKFSSAVLAKNKQYAEFTLLNTANASHTEAITLDGLSPGNYNILINNSPAGTFQAIYGQTASASFSIGSGSSYNIKLEISSPGANYAPSVDAGSDATVILPAAAGLSGSASDDGLPNGTLTTTWSNVSGPGTVAFANAGALNTTASFSIDGNYVLQLTAYDGELSSSDTVSITVLPQGTASNIAGLATATTSYVSPWETIDALNDGIEPNDSSGTNPSGISRYGNWNNPGSTQWVEYQFSQSYTISSMDVYWFDDNMGIALPASCAVKYWNGSNYASVSNPSGLGTSADQYNHTTFTPVNTTRIRLEITAASGYSSGILEWKVFGSE